jgi:drug/metabolite transporter (DMT)-like permease
MSDQAKGLMITTLAVLMVVPDSLFVRLIGADALVIAFWRGVVSGGLILLGVLAWQGTRPYRALPGTGIYGAIYVLAVGAAGVLFPLAVSLTSVANVVFIIAALPVFAALYSRIFLGEAISRRMVLTMIAVAVGLAILGYGSAETRGAHWTGDVTALGCRWATWAPRRCSGLSWTRKASPMGNGTLSPFTAPSSPAVQWGWRWVRVTSPRPKWGC